MFKKIDESSSLKQEKPVIVTKKEKVIKIDTSRQGEKAKISADGAVSWFVLKLLFVERVIDELEKLQKTIKNNVPMKEITHLREKLKKSRDNIAKTGNLNEIRYFINEIETDIEEMFLIYRIVEIDKFGFLFSSKKK